MRTAALTKEERVDRVANYIRTTFKKNNKPVIIPRTTMSKLVETGSVQEHRMIRYAVGAQPDIVMKLADIKIPRAKRPYAYTVIDGKKPMITTGALRQINDEQFGYLKERLYEEDKPQSNETFAKMVMMSDLFLQKNSSNEWVTIDYDFFMENLVITKEVVITFLSFFFERQVWAEKDLNGEKIYRIAFSEKEFEQYMNENISSDIQPDDIPKVEEFSKTINRHKYHHKQELKGEAENDSFFSGQEEIRAAVDDLVIKIMKKACSISPERAKILETENKELREANDKLASEKALAGVMLSEGREAFKTLEEENKRLREEVEEAKKKLKIYKGYEKDISAWQQSIMTKIQEEMANFNVKIGEDVMKYGNSMPSSSATLLKSSLMRQGMSTSDNIERSIKRILNPGKELDEL